MSNFHILVLVTVGTNVVYFQTGQATVYKQMAMKMVDNTCVMIYVLSKLLWYKSENMFEIRAISDYLSGLVLHGHHTDEHLVTLSLQQATAIVT